MRVHYRSCDVGLINKSFFFGSDILNKSDFFHKASLTTDHWRGRLSVNLFVSHNVVWLQKCMSHVDYFIKLLWCFCVLFQFQFSFIRATKTFFKISPLL